MSTPLAHLGRILPTRTTLSVVVGLVWTVSFGAARDFVWADLKSGMISLQGLSRTTRALVWFGLTLLTATVGALLVNHLWRFHSELVALGSSLTNAGRGSLVPTAVIPLTLFLVSVGWSFLLAGALHAGRWTKLGALVLYLLLAAGWIHAGDQTFLAGSLYGPDLGQVLWLLGGWALLLAVPAYFAVRRRVVLSPALDFCILLLLVGGTLILAQGRMLEMWRSTGGPMLTSVLQLNLMQLANLVTPFILLIGVEITLMVRQAGAWTVAVVTERMPYRWPQALLAVVLGARLWQVSGEAAERIAREGLLTEVLQYGAALSVPLLVLLVWWVVTRGAGAGDLADEGEDLAAWVRRYAFPLILLFTAMPLLGGLVTALAHALPQTATTLALKHGSSGVVRLFNEGLHAPWQVALDLLLLGAAGWLVYRGRRALALYLGLLGLLHLWWRSLWPGNLFQALSWSGSEPEDFWWVVIFSVFAVVWAVRGQLTTARAAGLLALATMTWLLGMSDLIDDPYMPFFLTYGGIGFLVFGILWDALTVGSWANEESPRLPRVSRVLLYVGYVLLTAAVIQWVLTTHDLYFVGQFTGDTALNGLESFGKPLLFAVFALMLAALARQPSTPTEA